MNSKVTMALRIILGLILILFGANKFGNFMDMGTMPKEATDFFWALGSTGYMLKFMGGVEIILGLLLVIGKWVPLALIILATMAANFLMFHINLAPGGIGPAALVAILNALLIYAYWDKFKSLF